MDIVAGFFGLLQLSFMQKKELREEIDIVNVINAHVQWKVRLQRYCNGTSTEVLDVSMVCRDDQCDLGKWIYSPVTQKFYDDRCFARLRADHARFHSLASSVVEWMQTGREEEAMRLFANEYQHVSFKMVKTLIELNKQLECE